MLEEIYKGNKLFYSTVKKMLEFDENLRPTFEEIKSRIPSRRDIENHFDEQGDMIPPYICDLEGEKLKNENWNFHFKGVKKREIIQFDKNEKYGKNDNEVVNRHVAKPILGPQIRISEFEKNPKKIKFRNKTETDQRYNTMNHKYYKRPFESDFHKNIKRE